MLAGRNRLRQILFDMRKGVADERRKTDNRIHRRKSRIPRECE